MKNLFLLLALLLVPAWAEATTWYTGTGGSNSNTCNQAETHATRKLTVAAGLACMSAAGGGGHTLNITAGTYNEFLLDVPSGTAGNVNTVRSYSTTDTVIFNNPGGAVGGPVFNFYNTGKQYVNIVGGCTTGLNRTCRMNFDNNGQAFNGIGGGQFITFDGVRIHSVLVGGAQTTGVAVNIGSNNNTFKNCRIDHNGTTPDGAGQAGYAFYIGGNNNLVENCELDNQGGYAIHQYSEEGAGISNNTYRFNFIHDNGQLVTGNVADGILLSGVSGSSNNAAYGNVIWNNARGYGIRLNRCTDCLVYNNTIYNNGADVGADGIYLQTSVGAFIRNNIVSANAVNQILDTGTGTTPSHNLCSSTCVGTSNPTPEAASVTFNNPAAANFTLKTGSGAINAGFTLAAPYNKSIDGTTRTDGFFDVGAYETSMSAPSCPATSPALVASYSFENVATDSSGNGFTATLGTGVTYTTGKYGQGVTFTGAGGVTVPDANALDMCGGFTFMGWINLPDTSADYVLIVKNPDSSMVLFASLNSVCGAGRPNAGYSVGGVGVNICYGTALTTGTFHHLAATYDSTFPTNSLKLYINGQQVAATDGTALLDATTGTLQFCTSGFSENCPSGTILDEVKIYNYPRTSPQIVTDMGSAFTRTVKIGAGQSLKIGLQ